jgi:hypothetical protein
VKYITIPKQSISMNCQIFTNAQIQNLYSYIEFEKNDLGFSWLINESRITPFNKSELLIQLKTWCSCQSTGEYNFRSRETNRRTFETNDGQIWYVVVVQQFDHNEDMVDMPICPMSSMLFGYYVSGMVSAFKEEFWADLFFHFVNNIDTLIENSQSEDYEFIILRLFDKLERERREKQERLERERREEEERLERERRAEREQEIVERERLRLAVEKFNLEVEKMRAEEAEAKLLAVLDAEENKKSSPKKKKEKKVKEAKVQVNPHKKEIRVSEGIWKPNPAWKKWEQENKRSASPP